MTTHTDVYVPSKPEDQPWYGKQPEAARKTRATLEGRTLNMASFEHGAPGDLTGHRSSPVKAWQNVFGTVVFFLVLIGGVALALAWVR